MKAKIFLIAVLLVAVIVGASVLYGVLNDSAGLAGLPVMNQNGQQADNKESPPQEGQPEVGTQDPAPGPGSGQQDPAPDQGGGKGASPASDVANETDIKQTGEQEDEGFTAPDFTVQDADGNDVSLSELFGKPIVVNFWTSWCPPCKAEMPEFNKVFGELGGEIQFMMVCLVDGRRETVATGAAYVEENGYTFPVYYDVNREAAMSYAVTSIPATYIINADGLLIAGVRGAIDESTLRLGIDMAS